MVGKIKPHNTHVPWMPVPYETADVSAIQALERGDASPDQQQRALKWMIYNATGTFDMDWFPGAQDAARDSDFAAGRRFVGLQIVKMLKLNLIRLTEIDKQTRSNKP